jgi:elongation factor Tu
MDTVDTYIKQPERAIDAPFLLSIESTLVAKGRGTVVTGKVDQGKVNINDELEVVGSDSKPTICLGLECFVNL